MAERVSLDIEVTTIVKIALAFLAIIFIYVLKDVLLIVFLAILISSAVVPLANALRDRGFPKILAVVLIYLGFFALLGMFLSYVLPIISHELNELGDALPRLISEFSEGIEAGDYTEAQGTFAEEAKKLLLSLSESLRISSSSYFSVLFTVFGGLISFIAVVIISFYFSIMENGVVGFFKSILPQRYEKYIISLWRRAEQRVARWIRGQLLLAVTVGVVVYVGLLIIGVKYALLLALLAMILELIPVAGPIIAAVPALLFAYIQTPTLLLWVLVLYVGVQQLENHVLAPLIIGKSVGLHPVTVVISLLIGAKLAGILGILLAVPVAVILVEIFEDLAKQKEVMRLAKQDSD